MHMVRVYNYNTNEVLEKTFADPQMLMTLSTFWTFWKPTMNDSTTAKSSIKSFSTGQV